MPNTFTLKLGTVHSQAASVGAWYPVDATTRELSGTLAGNLALPANSHPNDSVMEEAPPSSILAMLVLEVELQL